MNMIKMNKNFAVTLGTAVLTLGLIFPAIGVAATTPNLGAATSYAVLSSTYTNTAPGTTVNGDVGFTTGPAVAPAGIHLNYGSGAPYSQAGTDQGSALNNLNSQTCTFTFAPGAINLSTDTTHGTIGVYSPGVYCVSGAMNVGGPLSLSGNGTYIFRSTGALNSTAGAIVSLNGAASCDVFWTPGAATTLAANTSFQGTVISNAGITVGANTSWTGRALAFGGTNTTDTVTLSAPVCATAVATVTVVATTTPVVTQAPATTTPVVVVQAQATTTPVVVNPIVIPATIVTPSLPNTGFAPKDSGSSTSLFVLFALVISGASVLVILKRKN